MIYKKVIIIQLTVVLLLSSVPQFAFAVRIPESAYGYPYKDPYIATMTVPLMKGHEKWPSCTFRDIEEKVLDQRNRVYLLEGEGTLHYRFYRQPEPAPLIFIIPGLGSSAYTGTTIYLAEWLMGHGFQVVLLPSPFNWNFTLAASTSGVPGFTQDDSKDLYTVMQRVLNHIAECCQAKISKVGLMGLSDGALYAGFIAKLDSAQNKIGIDTCLLVNPPVDLLQAARTIDRMADSGKGYSDEYRDRLEGYAFGAVAGAARNDIDAPGYFSDWKRRLRLTDEQIKYLIGQDLQKSIGDAIYVIELAQRPGILKSGISWGYRSERLDEARSYSLIGYLQTFLVPSLVKTGDKQMSMQKLDTIASLKAIKVTLENDRRIFVMHNLDDFLVSRQDMDYLENTFGNRATLYPHGGHLGNLWYADNKRDILDVFKHMLSTERQTGIAGR